MKKVSIIIPTFNRPRLLEICLWSCINQTRQPDEIVIGDDSTTIESQKLVEGICNTVPIQILYNRNTPPLGQGYNIDSLLCAATGDYICLIHDDDYLEPLALERMVPVFQDPRVVIAFGKQTIVSNEGRVDMQASQDLNTAYRRTQLQAGLQASIFESAVIQQVPNNGFVVKAEMAKTVGYKNAYRLFGDACDAGFAILLAEKYPEMKAYFIDEYLAAYRLSTQSVARSKPDNNAATNYFGYIYEYATKVQPSKEVECWLRQNSSVAIGAATDLGRLRDSMEWLLSRYHRYLLLSPGGLRRSFRLARASVKRLLVC